MCRKSSHSVGHAALTLENMANCSHDWCHRRIMSAKIVLTYIIQLMILSPTPSLTPSLNQYSSRFKSEELSSSVSE